MNYRIKAVADLVGKSVRTLHYYDRIGLLRPESQTPAGYRLYSDSDLEKLQQVLFFKELGFSLKQTKEIILNPDFDRKRALISHRSLLMEKADRLEKLISSVEKRCTVLTETHPGTKRRCSSHLT